MACWRSMASCTCARWRDGSPESSKMSSLTGWPLRPPLELMNFAHSCAPSVTGLRVEAAGPDWGPTLAPTSGDDPAGGTGALGAGAAGAPGVGFGAPGFGADGLPAEPPVAAPFGWAAPLADGD